MDEYKDLKPKEETFPQNDLFSRKKQDIRIVDFDSFEDNLNISDIKDEHRKLEQEKKPPGKKNSLKIFTGENIDKDFSVDLENINEDEFNERKISLCSLQSEEFNCNNINNDLNNNDNKKRRQSLFSKKETKKITKEDLNYIPLPVFSCIYCSNDDISFKHLSQEIISNIYLFQSSVYDIIELNKLISYQPIVDKDLKNEKLLDIIIKNTEYIKTLNSKENVKNFFKSEYYFDLCKRELLNDKKIFMNKIEDSVIKKKKDFYFMGINRISKNSLNNKCLFNSTNSLINNYNALSGFVETIPINNNININNGKNTNNISNLSINFNSISSNNNEIGHDLGKDNNNLFVNILEKIENNAESANEIEDKEEIMDIFKFDMERKIKKEDIVWENNIYNIWNPNISNDDLNELSNIYPKKEENIKTNKNNKLIRLKVNLIKPNDLSKGKPSNNSFINQIKKRLNISQVKSMGSTNNSSRINFDNENLIKSNILNYTKDFSSINRNNIINNSQIPINTNIIKIDENLSNISNCKEKMNCSNINKISFSNRIDNILKKMKGNKINYNFINKSQFESLNKSNIINKSLIKSNSKNTKKNSFISNYNCISNKTFSFNDIKIKEAYKKNIENNKILKENNILRKINCYTSFISSNNKYIKTYNHPYTYRTNDSISFKSSRNDGTKITSSKIKYNKNNNLLNSFNNGYIKFIKVSPKIGNLSNYSSNLSKKLSKNGPNINNHSEIIKINKKNINIKNCPKLKNNKINSSVIISNKNLKFNKLKCSFELYEIRRSINNSILKTNNKININKTKIIDFKSSFKKNSTSKALIKKKINILKSHK